VIRFELTDPTPGAPWQSVFYRAVAWGQTDRPNGIYGGRSLPSPSVEVVPGSPLPPTLTDPLLEDVPTEPDFWLVSFQTDVTLARTLRGAHTFAVHSVLPDASIQTARETADRLPVIAATLPTPLDQPCTIFRFDPTNPRAGRTYAWVPRTVSAVILEVTDPAGRTTRHTETL
jgi:hypothetical protein